MAQGRASVLTREEWTRVLGAAFLVGIVVVGVRSIPGTGMERLDVFAGFVLTLLPIALLIWWVASGPGKAWELGVMTAVALVVGSALSWAGWPSLALPFKAIAGAAAGTLLGRQFAEGWWLALVAVVAVVVDVWSVFAGPTKMVVEEAPVLLDYLLLHFPILGGGPMGSGLGLSDVIFVGLFTSGALVTGLRLHGTFLALCLGLVATMALALSLPVALPALPLLGLTFLLANADRLLSRKAG